MNPIFLTEDVVALMVSASAETMISGMETIDNILCDIEMGDDKKEEKKTASNDSRNTSGLSLRDKNECIP